MSRRSSALLELLLIRMPLADLIPRDRQAAQVLVREH